MRACRRGAARAFGLVVDQIHFLGNYSLVDHHRSRACSSASCSALQGYYTLQRYGSAEALGLLVALSLVRELGPVVTALLFAGRAGTSLTAEIGLMKAGEQLAAMEMMAVDPVQRILAPRFWAASSPCRCWRSLFCAVGILGGYVVGVLLIGVDAGAFWSIRCRAASTSGATSATASSRASCSASSAPSSRCYQGYEAQPTPEGVSRATTRTVVVASLAVLGSTSCSPR